MVKERMHRGHNAGGARFLPGAVGSTRFALTEPK